MNNDVFIFIGGNAPEHNIVTWSANYIVVADSGLKVCKQWNMVPHMVIGDFDSISLEEAKGYAPDAVYDIYKQDKDYTDTELALQHAYRQNPHGTISLIGGTGGRIEHFLGLLTLFQRKYTPHRIIAHTYQFELLYDTHTIDCTHIPNKYISFFSLTEHTTQSSSGLRWNLDNIMLSSERTSLSNEYVEDRVHITMHTGLLLGVWQHGDVPQKTHAGSR